MKKKVLLSLIFILLISTYTKVFALVDVKNNDYMVEKLANNMTTPKISGISSKDDLVTVKATGNVVGYYYGTSTKVNDAKFTSTSSTTYYAAVKNGIYYFWVAGSGVSTGNVNAIMYPYAVKITTSCYNQSVKNCTGSGTFERCYVYTGGKSVSPESGGTLVTPANGYKLESLVVSKNNCSNLSLNVGNQKLSKRYCKVVLAYKCSKINPSACDKNPNSADCICSKDANSASCACARDANSADCACKKNPNSTDCYCKTDANSKNCICAKNPNSVACKGCPSGTTYKNGRCVTVVPQPIAPTTPYLTGLSVSPGTLSPAFDTHTVGYTVTVEPEVSQITINAVGSRGSASGTIYGTGVKNLSYGTQKFKITITNSAASIDYEIIVTRKKACNKDNTLKDLTISEGDLDPHFQAGVNSYNVKFNKETTFNVAATLNDGKASFVEGYGPRTVTVKPGSNRVDIRVKNECGDVRTYAINATVPPVCDPNPETSARLKSIELKSSRSDVLLPTIDFKPDEYIYSDIEIPFDYGTLDIVVGTEKEGDIYEIKDMPSVFSIEKETPVSIVVTSKKCPDVQKTYTLIITRLPKKDLNSDPSLASFSISGHNEFKFKKNQSRYDVLKLKKNEKTVTLSYVPEQSTTVCFHYTSNDLDNKKDNNNNNNGVTKTADGSEQGNEGVVTEKIPTNNDNKVEVSLGDEIYVECRAEDGMSKETYIVKVVSAAKKTNVLLVALIVIIILLLLVYLVLRLLGYKIYFNFAMIGAFFRGIGESIKNIFDR